MATRIEVKALLARAGVEISNTLHRVDKMPDSELAEIEKLKGTLAANFYDKNGSCGAATLADLAAYYDKNGSCAAHAQAREEELSRVVKA